MPSPSAPGPYCAFAAVPVSFAMSAPRCSPTSARRPLARNCRNSKPQSPSSPPASQESSRPKAAMTSASRAP
eukprot:CAMPEP_0170285634 /NCGR_PEP_ID=MMETSP0116_2-20130129/42869_1 /TAXON_ID=400756 /ORGANISM="Durinskia baltica, Strain CSIRO CS-38" /LENGTH=71 /DNA_ID=CAMNT_0010537041 /DNA_START=535 /DNA_END=746 /DNA_ORIENTATION=-